MTKGSGRAATAIFALRETRLEITTDDRWMTISIGFEYLPLASFKEHGQQKTTGATRRERTVIVPTV